MTQKKKKKEGKGHETVMASYFAQETCLVPLLFLSRVFPCGPLILASVPISGDNAQDLFSAGQEQSSRRKVSHLDKSFMLPRITISSGKIRTLSSFSGRSGRSFYLMRPTRAEDIRSSSLRSINFSEEGKWRYQISVYPRKNVHYGANL